ncbi:hypothetical protein GLAREA_05677 [Glarea lozoyensis ATCC 20868]|uniref:Uncharacterized protein n=1 Tax=Glarea lozoyensis (strain ATCC 20868 / MF5171) TaxID=1116229 RepID=S3DGT8_GLAL2|nr:uncharacterized protein GLAREA_05677 [Glarea lozoyensis ATCC 20868]EPE36339.1 hypothetical protein GLAREA_05677 [Glarea lozoyensis ATCC 20868]
MLNMFNESGKSSTPGRTAAWGVHWLSPFTLIGSTVTGILLAGSHYAYYSFLNNQLAGSEMRQQWSLGIGTGISVLAKASFCTALVVAMTQRLWTVLRKRSLSLKAVDNAFALNTSILAFLDLEVLARAKLLS